MQQAHEKMMLANIGTIHFVGIGGIGMSGIAEILMNLGCTVQGSDLYENDNVKRLKTLGIKVYIGQDKNNIVDAHVIVKSTAVKDDNPEIIAARKFNIPVIKRAEMLAELMRFKISIGITGTHGKTTTTSLVGALFEAAELNPTVINGGIINAKGTNAYLGSGDYLIAEADESDETFIKVPCTIGAITNIEAEHLDHYGSFENLKNAYIKFIENIPFYGFVVACKDHEVTASLISNISDREILTYGIASQGLDVKAINIRNEASYSEFDVILSSRIAGVEKTIKNIHLPMVGLHNVLNSLAAIAIAAKLNFSDNIIKNGFKAFRGVKRRFTKVAEIGGVTIIDDYAHHPTEIKATLQTAKIAIHKTNGARIIAIAQPHRYSRLQDLFSEFTHCFELADVVIIADIYSAGEKPIPGVSKDVLASAIKQVSPNKDVRALQSGDKLAALISEIAQPGDIALCMGAGTISKWAYKLPQELELARV
jgi:UDP-N-acetylmuramate--alanine ligase